MLVARGRWARWHPSCRPRRRPAEAGASSVEYALAAAGVAGVIALAAMGLGDRLAGVFECLSQQVGGAATACSSGSTEEPNGGPTGSGDPTDLTEPDPTDPATGPTSAEPSSSSSASTASTTTTTSTTSTTTVTGTSPSPTESPSPSG